VSGFDCPARIRLVKAGARRAEAVGVKDRVQEVLGSRYVELLQAARSTKDIASRAAKIETDTTALVEQVGSVVRRVQTLPFVLASGGPAAPRLTSGEARAAALRLCQRCLAMNDVWGAAVALSTLAKSTTVTELQDRLVQLARRALGHVARNSSWSKKLLLQHRHADHGFSDPLSLTVVYKSEPRDGLLFDAAVMAGCMLGLAVAGRDLWEETLAAVTGALAGEAVQKEVSDALCPLVANALLKGGQELWESSDKGRIGPWMARLEKQAVWGEARLPWPDTLPLVGESNHAAVMEAVGSCESLDQLRRVSDAIKSVYQQWDEATEEGVQARAAMLAESTLKEAVRGALIVLRHELGRLGCVHIVAAQGRETPPTAVPVTGKEPIHECANSWSMRAAVQASVEREPKMLSVQVEPTKEAAEWLTLAGGARGGVDILDIVSGSTRPGVSKVAWGRMGTVESGLALHCKMVAVAVSLRLVQVLVDCFEADPLLREDVVGTFVGMCTTFVTDELDSRCEEDSSHMSAAVRAMVLSNVARMVAGASLAVMSAVGKGGGNVHPLLLGATRAMNCAASSAVMAYKVQSGAEKGLEATLRGYVEQFQTNAGWEGSGSSVWKDTSGVSVPLHPMPAMVDAVRLCERCIEVLCPHPGGTVGWAQSHKHAQAMLRVLQDPEDVLDAVVRAAKGDAPMTRCASDTVSLQEVAVLGLVGALPSQKQACVATLRQAWLSAVASSVQGACVVRPCASLGLHMMESLLFAQASLWEGASVRLRKDTADASGTLSPLQLLMRSETERGMCPVLGQWAMRVHRLKRGGENARQVVEASALLTGAGAMALGNPRRAAAKRELQGAAGIVKLALEVALGGAGAHADEEPDDGEDIPAIIASMSDKLVDTVLWTIVESHVTGIAEASAVRHGVLLAPPSAMPCPALRGLAVLGSSDLQAELSSGALFRTLGADAAPPRIPALPITLLPGADSVALAAASRVRYSVTRSVLPSSTAQAASGAAADNLWSRVVASGGSVMGLLAGSKG
jgi:hypothetical protein